MRVLRKTLLVTLVCLVASAQFGAQTPQPSTTSTVLRLVPMAGVFTPADGGPPAAVEVVTLSIYAEESGGRPIWEETQRVPVDTSGRYSLLLGASLADGLPLDIFASGEARWLAIRFARPGEVDGPRARLTSVPYALHAANAETLGGRPASAYMLAPTHAERGSRAQAAITESEGIVMNGDLPGINFLAKYVTGSTIGASAVYESAGSVGIGTSTPFDAMHLRFTNTGGTQTGLAVQNLGATATSYSGMLFYDQNGALAQFQGFNNVTHEYRINNIARTSGVLDGSINFMTGSASRFFVATSGAIGIGTTTPAVPLQVMRSPGFADAAFTSYNSSFDGGAFIDGWRSRGTVASPTAVVANDLLASFGAAAYDSTAFVRAASINLVALNNWSPISHPTDIRFNTTEVGTTTLLERMRIQHDGYVSIGTMGPAADRLNVFGEVRVLNCVKRSDGSGIAGVCPSDQRLKRDITSFGPALPAVAALRPVHYYWRAAEFPERQFGDRQSYGLIAQEVEEILPDLVVTNPDGYKAVDYAKLPLLTVQAIKELKAKTDALEIQNHDLQSRIAELERVVKQLLADRSRF